MTSPDVVTIYVDGASRGNPGPSGIGAVFLNAHGKIIVRLFKYLGDTTNNVAEYLAFIYALQEAHRRGWRRLVVRTDSELLAKQLSGAYKVRDTTLRLLHDLATTLQASCDSCLIEHVGREFNAEADRLAAEGVKARPDVSVKIVNVDSAP